MDSQSALDIITARNAAHNTMSVVELRALASQVDINTGNATVVLWSGGVGAMVTETKNLIKSYEVYFDYRCPIQG